MITAIISLSVIVILTVPEYASQSMALTVEEMMPKTVQGKYVNSEFGLEITFPEGSTANVVPNGPGSITLTANLPIASSGGVGNGAKMGIIFLDFPKYATTMGIHTSGQNTSCTSPPIGTFNVGGKDAQVREHTCSGTDFGGIVGAKTKSYLVDLGNGRFVEFILQSDASGYDVALKTFEQILKTAKFTP